LTTSQEEALSTRSRIDVTLQCPNSRRLRRLPFLWELEAAESSAASSFPQKNWRSAAGAESQGNMQPLNLLLFLIVFPQERKPFTWSFFSDLSEEDWNKPTILSRMDSKGYSACIC